VTAGVARTNEHGQPIGDPVDWAGAEAPRPVTLEAEHVRLEPLRGDHAQGIHDHLGAHPELWTYRSDEPPASVKEAAQLVAHGASESDHLTWAVVPTASGECEGMLSWCRIAPATGSVEVAAVIYGPDLQRTRAATQAQHLLMRHAFDDLGYRRYEWKCDSLNQPSRDAALRLGFVEEGTWRHALVYKGRNRDTTWFSITDTEWPAVDAAIEAWLDDDNHDGDGRQRRSLGDVRRDHPR
jgi:RimJ/RimL family protein N-acetyltransferase